MIRCPIWIRIPTHAHAQFDLSELRRGYRIQFQIERIKNEAKFRWKIMNKTDLIFPSLIRCLFISFIIWKSFDHASIMLLWIELNWMRSVFIGWVELEQTKSLLQKIIIINTIFRQKFNRLDTEPSHSKQTYFRQDFQSNCWDLS